tara:strand:- start:8510 stop:8761 length:252 start_codon:yes stop_codon:yes gene_type:complete
MAVVMRLARGGSTHRPVYRITVADSRLPRDGKYLEVLGQYNPAPKGQDKEITLDMNRVNHWMERGAKPSERVKKIIQKAKSLN